MSTSSRFRVSTLAFVIGVMSAGVLQAQISRAPAAPVPTQINSANKVFISNAGGQCPSFGDTTFSGTPDRSYDEFYAAMKSWGRYELASAPAGADLVFEINLTCELFPDAKRSATNAQFRLLILDPKTRIVLWGFTQRVPVAQRLSNRDKNFDQSMTALVEKVKRLLGSTTSAAVYAKPGTRPDVSSTPGGQNSPGHGSQTLYLL